MNDSIIAIKIQDGCSQRCSYCATRLYRGASVSIPYKTIYDNIKLLSKLEKANHVYLCGVNSLEYYDEQVGDYCALLQKLIIDFPNMLFSLEFINPFFVDKAIKIMDLVKNNPDHLSDNFCIDIQSASDKLLKSMHRPYNKEVLTKIFDYAKNNGIKIRTEIIVGFPGETEEDFLETYDFLSKYEFDFLACVFSPMKGTEAISLPNKVSDETAIKRMEKLKQLKDKLGYES